MPTVKAQSGIVLDEEVSGTNAYSSDWIKMGKAKSFYLQTSYESVTGTFLLEMRAPGMPAEEVTDVTIENPAGSPGGEPIVVGNATAPEYKITYTNASGTGNVKVAITPKVES